MEESSANVCIGGTDLSVVKNAALVNGTAQGLGTGIVQALPAEGAVAVCADISDATPVAGQPAARLGMGAPLPESGST